MNRSTINYLKTAMLFAAPAGLSAALGYAVGGWLGLMLCAAAWISSATIIFFCADRIILTKVRAEHVPECEAPGLYALLGELSRRAQVRSPALYLLPEAAPQMLVTGRTADRGAIGLSQGLLELLSMEELAAVIAHAIHHLRSGETQPMTMAAGLVAALISVSNFFRWSNLLGKKWVRPESRGGIPSDAVLWVLIAPIAAALVKATAYPSRQLRADVASAHLIGDAHALCTALTKMELRTPQESPECVSPATAHLFFCAPVNNEDQADLFRTHPPIAERLRRVEELGRAIHYFKRVMKLRHANEYSKDLREERTIL